MLHYTLFTDCINKKDKKLKRLDLKGIFYVSNGNSTPFVGKIVVGIGKTRVFLYKLIQKHHVTK